MNKVVCNECGKTLFETESIKPVQIGIQCQDKGFIYKNACLFSEKYTSLYFCDDTCAKLFYSKNIKRNPEITKVIDQLKSEIPQMAKDCCKGLDKLSKLFPRQ